MIAKATLSETVRKPVGLSDLFMVMFIGLKLSHQIDWSWWWVMSPLWIGVSLAVLAAILKGAAK